MHNEAKNKREKSGKIERCSALQAASCSKLYMEEGE